MWVVRKAITAIALAVTLATPAGAEEQKLPLPDVTVTAPGPNNTPPYLRDQKYRNPYMGRFRVEEDKFTKVPCTDTRVAAPGASCLRGIKLEPSTGAFRPCEMALDVTMFDNAQIAVEADILILDPYKVTATGTAGAGCDVRGRLDYDEVDFGDMNQITRRGANFRNLVGAGDDKSIEFDVDGRHCKAIRHTGPRWQRGYVYIGHISICRKDAAQVQAEDIAYVFNTLRVRTFDPTGNLRANSNPSEGVAPLPSDPNMELRPR